MYSKKVLLRGYVRNRLGFTFGNVKLEIVTAYQYLGLIFNSMGNLTKQNRNYMREVVGQCSLYYVTLALYLYLLMSFLNLLTVYFFPIITYGCKIWEVRTSILSRNSHLGF